MDLVISWWSIVSQLQGAFSRKRTFYWSVMVIMGFCTRQDSMGGVSSFIRCVGIEPKKYQRLLAFFHSRAINLDKLTELWVVTVFSFFKTLFVTLNGHPILVLDGINIAKEGQSMPSVQTLHQASASNSKAEYIMGHLFQCVGILVGSPLNTIFSVPLFGRIHLGTKVTNTDKRTQFDKALSMMNFIPLSNHFYLVADSYYSTRKMLNGIVKRGCHVITKVKSTAVAYFPVPKRSKKGRGRPKKYGKKVKLIDLFLDETKFTELTCCLYGAKEKVLVRSIDLLSRGFFGMTLKYVLVIHPNRGRMILLSTDLSLTAEEIIQVYSYRFKIEVAFKSAIYSIGVFLYRFWMSGIEKISRGDKTIYLHKKSKEYRNRYFNKMRAYEVYVQLGLIAQGVMLYLSLFHTKAVWGCFETWIRTIRPNVRPTEMVVGMSLRNVLIYFLEGNKFPPNLQKFIRENTLIPTFKGYRLTG